MGKLSDTGAARPDMVGKPKAHKRQEAVAHAGPDVVHPVAAEGLRRMERRAKGEGQHRNAGAASGSIESPLPENLQTMIDALSEQVALLDPGGIIVASNRSWRGNMAVRGGARVGLDYVSHFTEIVKSGYEPVRPLLKGLQLVRSGERDRFEHLYIGTDPVPSYWLFEFSRIQINAVDYVMVAMRDAEELVRLKRQRRQLQGRVLHAQEEERRHIARELHDSTGQLVTSLQLGLMRLKSADRSAHSELILAELGHAAAEIQHELRALSFMCHPPELTKGGLVAALSGLVSGFGNRTGLETDFSTDVHEPCSPAVEATIYRVAQEALSNVYRHSRGTCVAVQLLGRPRAVHLRVRDDGIGFDPSQHNGRTKFGVGTSGMRERLLALGGRLSIAPAHPGTALIASLPRHEPEVRHAGSEA